MGNQIADKIWIHVSRNGTIFSSETSDLKSGIKAHVKKYTSLEKLAADVSEMIGEHAIHIRPGIHRFSGYDELVYTIVYK